MANNNLYSAYKEAKITGIITSTFDKLDFITKSFTDPLGNVSAKMLEKTLDKAIANNNKMLGIWSLLRALPHIGRKNYLTSSKSK